MRRAGRGRALRVRGRRRAAARPRASTRGRHRTVTRSQALARGTVREPNLAGTLDYVAMMEEPLELALDLVRGLSLAARGMDDGDSGRSLLALVRAVSGELHQAKGMLATLMKLRAEMTSPLARS